MKLFKRFAYICALSMFLTASAIPNTKSGIVFPNYPPAADNVPANRPTVNIIFGIYSNDRPSTLNRAFKPTLDALEVEMEKLLEYNVSFSVRITKSYEEAIDLIASGTFDIVRFGPVSYVLAKKKNPEIKIVAVENVRDSKVFEGVLVVKEDSDIENIDDIRGKKFAFGNEKSTIGRYLVQQLLMENDIFDSDLGEYKYFDRHDLVARAVALGDYDVGALKEDTFDKLVQNGLRLKELHRFPNVTKPWIVSDAFPDEIVGVMQEAFDNLNGNEKVKSSLKIDGFFKGNDSDYDRTREAIEHNSEFFKSSTSSD